MRCQQDDCATVAQSTDTAAHARQACGQDTTGTPKVTITPVAGADLAVANTGAPNPVVSGQPLTYTVTATNTGGQAATEVKVTDPLPASAVFKSMSATQGSCQRSAAGPSKNKDGTVTCNLGTLAAGGIATVTIVVTPTKAGTLTTGTATVTASNVTSDTDDSTTAMVTVHGT